MLHTQCVAMRARMHMHVKGLSSFFFIINSGMFQIFGIMCCRTAGVANIDLLLVSDINICLPIPLLF